MVSKGIMKLSARNVLKGKVVWGGFNRRFENAGVWD